MKTNKDISILLQSQPPKKEVQPHFLECASENEIINPPIVQWVYFDHELKCNKICIVVAMVTGATDINFNIAENSKEILISYVWPSAIFCPQELFGKEIKIKESMIEALLKIGLTPNSNPKCTIKIPLLFVINKEPKTWKKKAIKGPNGQMVIFLEFCCFTQQVIIDDEDTSLHFN